MNSYISLLRPKQWLKNLLVFAAPFAAGQLFSSGTFFNSLIAFTAFICISSSIYVLNDLRDADKDRLHPKKMHRPIASESVSQKKAIYLAFLLAIAAVFLSASLSNWYFTFVLIGYFLSQVAYILFVKNISVVELFFVASGFVLRAIGGGLASSVAISDWFITVIASSALFIVAGKRFGEISKLGTEGQTRPVLQSYTPDFLRTVWTISLAAAIVFYVLWAVELDMTSSNYVALLSAVPFAIALLTYALSVDTGEAEAPEELMISNFTIIVMGISWMALMTLGTMT